MDDSRDSRKICNVTVTVIPIVEEDSRQSQQYHWKNKPAYIEKSWICEETCYQSDFSGINELDLL